MSTPKCKVYIASPYTIGDAGTNVKAQLDMAALLLDMGIIPFAPLLSHFLHMAHPRLHQEWLEYDFEWVKSCDALLRLPGESKGGDMEVSVAKASNIPVFSGLDNFDRLVDWAKNGGYYIDNLAMTTSTQYRYTEIVKIDPMKHI